jgi:FMN reductase
MSALKVVIVSGNLSQPSRTLALAEHILASLANQTKFDIDSEIIQLASIAGDLATAKSRKDFPESITSLFHAVESAHIVIAVTPVYRASYTGLFKLFFDWVGQDALEETPVILAATGGNDLHALVIEHELKPLFGFFRALTIPHGIYANESHFEDYKLHGTEVLEQIEKATKLTVKLAGLKNVAI